MHVWKTLSENQKVKLLFEALEGSEDANEGLSTYEDGKEMLSILLDVSCNLRLGLSK